MAPIRTFISFPLPADIRSAIGEFISLLKPHCGGVKWENPDKLHVTIKFLGDTVEGNVAGILAVLRDRTVGFSPFDLTVAGFGAFPSPRRPRVIWVGCENIDGTLLRIHGAIDEGLAPLGFPKEEHPFHPHVTIARVREQGGGTHLTSIPKNITFDPRHTLVCRNFSDEERASARRIGAHGHRVEQIVLRRPLARTSPTPKRKTVLFVDDEALWLNAVKAAVRGGPVKVITAAGGEEALEKMVRRIPDLILSDVRMPVMNGFDLFEKVKNNPKLRSIPYVFMSSIDDFDARKTAKDIGADDYVEKPFDVVGVKSILTDLLDRFSEH